MIHTQRFQPKTVSETSEYRVRYMSPMLIYMKPSDPFPSATAFKTLLCSSNNKRQIQKLICSYLADFARNMNVDVIYSIGSHCTNLSSQQNMDQYSFDQSEADTIIFSFYAVLHESGYAGPVVIDATDTVQMFTLQQHTYLISFLVCCAIRGSRKLSCVVV